MERVRFDDSLKVLAEVVAAELGEPELLAGTVLRDAVGQLAFFASQPLSEAIVERVSALLKKKLGRYARIDRVLADCEAFGADSILQDASALPLMVSGRSLRLVDRRLVGADWLRPPAPLAPRPVRFVFASLKGGVGRSTALAVVAMHLAARGQKVLAIDMDLEAPGLGSLLLTDETLPDFGMLDALVENNLSGLDAGFMADLVAASPLAGQRGRVDVIPALGRRSLENPAEVLAKLARAYVEDVRPGGKVDTILDQVRALVDMHSQLNQYDAILIDARAGLHETTAASVLGLGAEVLLFGLDEHQTFHGYSVLLHHLARFMPSDGTVPEWLDRLTMVQGKAPVDNVQREKFADKCINLFYDAGLCPPKPKFIEPAPSLQGNTGEFIWDDSLSDAEVLPPEWAPRKPVAVLKDSQYENFNPLAKTDLVSEGVYHATFASLLSLIEKAVPLLKQVESLL